MNWVDFVIIGICLLGITIGLWKGFVQSLLSIFGAFANFVLSFLLCKPAATFFIKHTKWDNALADKILSWTSGISGKFDTNMVGMGKAGLKSHINSTLSSKGFPKILQWLFKSTTNITPADLEGKAELTLGQVLSETITIVTFVVGCFLLISLVLFILYFILKKYTKIWIGKNRAVSGVDKGFGVVFGAAKGMLYVCAIFAVLSVFQNSNLLFPLFNAIDKSAIGGPISNWVFDVVGKYFNFNTLKSFISSRL